MNASAGLPDYDRIAAEFDQHLPLIAPVGLAVLDRLPALPHGTSVLDVACGTGEPGLTLARRSPGVQLLGVDAARGMIDVAKEKAAREGVQNARFEVMSAEALSCSDSSMDAVLSRFGLLMFGDIEASARELARVLRPGGHFSFAVWDDMRLNTLVHTIFAALRPLVPAELFAPFDSLNEAAAEGRRAAVLQDAGISTVHSEFFRWDMEFASDEALSSFVIGRGIFENFFARLDETQAKQVPLEVAAAMAAYRQGDGSYLIPHTCRLYWGSR